MGKRRRKKKNVRPREHLKNPPKSKSIREEKKKKEVLSKKDREEVKKYWINLSTQEMLSSLSINVGDLHKKLREKQKGMCSCQTCGKRKIMIEREIDRLFGQFCDELRLKGRTNKEVKDELPPVDSSSVPPLEPAQPVKPIQDTNSLLISREDDDDIFEDTIVTEEEKMSHRFGKSLMITGKDQRISSKKFDEEVLTLKTEWIQTNGEKVINIFSQFERQALNSNPDFEILLGTGTRKKKGKHDHCIAGKGGSRGSRDHHYSDSDDHSLRSDNSDAEKRDGQRKGTRGERGSKSSRSRGGNSQNSKKVIRSQKKRRLRRGDMKDEYRSDETNTESESGSMSSDSEEDYRGDGQSAHTHDYALEEKKWRESVKHFRILAAKLLFEKIVMGFKEKKALELQTQLIESERKKKIRQEKKKKQKKKKKKKKKKKNSPNPDEILEEQEQIEKGGGSTGVSEESNDASFDFLSMENAIELATRWGKSTSKASSKNSSSGNNDQNKSNMSEKQRRRSNKKKKSERNKKSKKKKELLQSNQPGDSSQQQQEESKFPFDSQNPPRILKKQDRKKSSKSSKKKENKQPNNPNNSVNRNTNNTFYNSQPGYIPQQQQQQQIYNQQQIPNITGRSNKNTYGNEEMIERYNPPTATNYMQNQQMFGGGGGGFRRIHQGYENEAQAYSRMFGYQQPQPQRPLHQHRPNPPFPIPTTDVYSRPPYGNRPSQEHQHQHQQIIGNSNQQHLQQHRHQIEDEEVSEMSEEEEEEEEEEGEEDDEVSEVSEDDDDEEEIDFFNRSAPPKFSNNIKRRIAEYMSPLEELNSSNNEKYQPFTTPYHKSRIKNPPEPQFSSKSEISTQRKSRFLKENYNNNNNVIEDEEEEEQIIKRRVIPMKNVINKKYISPIRDPNDIPPPVEVISPLLKEEKTIKGLFSGMNNFLVPDRKKIEESVLLSEPNNERNDSNNRRRRELRKNEKEKLDTIEANTYHLNPMNMEGVRNTTNQVDFLGFDLLKRYKMEYLFVNTEGEPGSSSTQD